MAIFSSTGQATIESIENQAFKAGFGFFSSEHFTAPYQLYRAFNRYIYNSGKALMPVAAQGPTGLQGPVKARVVQLAQPYGWRIYKWACERQDAKPVLPHPGEQNPANEVFLDGEVWPHPPALDATGGVHTYFVEGWYRYALLVPLLNGTLNIGSTQPIVDQLRMGATPYDSTSAEENIYTPADFVPMQ